MSHRAVAALVVAALVVAAVMGAGSGAIAQPSLSQAAAACRQDAMRLCASDVPNRAAITACMKRHRADLSPGCGAMFDAGTTEASRRPAHD